MKNIRNENEIGILVDMIKSMFEPVASFYLIAVLVVALVVYRVLEMAIRVCGWLIAAVVMASAYILFVLILPMTCCGLAGIAEAPILGGLEVHDWMFAPFGVVMALSFRSSIDSGLCLIDQSWMPERSLKWRHHLRCGIALTCVVLLIIAYVYGQMNPGWGERYGCEVCNPKSVELVLAVVCFWLIPLAGIPLVGKRRPKSCSWDEA